MNERPGQLKLPLPSRKSKIEEKESSNTAGKDMALGDTAIGDTALSDTTDARLDKDTASPRQNQPQSKADNGTTRNTNEVIHMSEPKKSTDFESMLAELERVVGQLEGEVKLEEALSLFERGLELSQECEKFLKVAQQKIEILKRSANGELSTGTFAEDTEALV